MSQSYDFKASNVENAKRNGLAELGLTEDQVDIEIISNGGIFSKAVVRITPKEKDEVKEVVEETEDVVEEPVVEEPVAEEKEEVEPSVGKEESSEGKKTYDIEVLKALQQAGKEFLESFLKLAGGNVGFETKLKVQDGEICYYLNGDDAKNYIGYKGETLEAVQVLLSHFINQHNEGDHISVIVDADFYRERRKKTLTAMAKRLATQAYDQHREIALEPMNSYERRIIHTALQNSYEAETRSDGEGRDRHVVIVPKSGTMSYGTDSSFKRKGPAHTKSYGYDKKKFF